MDKESMTFETAMERLENVVRALESGEITLDKSLELFEEGVALARVCSARLDEVEAKIEVLLERNGEIVTEPFSESEGTES